MIVFFITIIPAEQQNQIHVDKWNPSYYNDDLSTVAQYYWKSNCATAPSDFTLWGTVDALEEVSEH